MPACRHCAPKGEKPMSDQQRVVLIGDADDNRFTWFKELLADVFAIGVIQARTFEEVKNFAQGGASGVTANVVFLADDLPYSVSTPRRDPKINFIKLEEYFYDADFVCVVTKERDPDLEGVSKQPHHVHLRSFPPSAENKGKVITELGGLGSRLRPALDLSTIAGITRWDRSSRTLRRQIRALSDLHDLEDGQKHLLRLIRNCVDCGGIRSLEIKQLGQGKSGASVFRITLEHASGTKKEYVLKLSGGSDLWKLESEVRGHLDAREHTGLPGYKEHVAALRKPIYSVEPTHPQRQFIVDSGHWYAIHYDFLGGPDFGEFIDLETELTAPPEVLIEKTANSLPKFKLELADRASVLAHRLQILGITLDGLSDLWYGKKGLGSRELLPIWNVENAEDRTYIRLPPYQLTRRVKGWVQDFLDSREAGIGPRLFPDWNDHRERVLTLVSDLSTPSDLGRLGLAGDIPFTLSPVHGDLNANNVMLWLEQEKYPFLIDLPFYQRLGHALQDFARFETEIKFGLMDRQEESPETELAAYDHCDSQVPLWIELDDRLLERRALDEAELGRADADMRDWGATGYQNNVTLCYRSIILTREKACAVQQKHMDGRPGPGPFAAEYLPALLYYTIRSIGYPSLSIFKRLLAVHSSGRIIEHLRHLRPPLTSGLATVDLPPSV
jgi:Ternary complex associated domain 9